MRTHVVIPEALVHEVDRLVGPRRRSEFFATAIEEKVARVRLLSAAQAFAGSLADVDTPGWESRESTAAWVHELRRDVDGRPTSTEQER